ncbi:MULTISPECIES: PQQ-binding-like beta-propeller repeat protein [unclassified Lentimonas]|uniref:outer membrane protein assembly factor BamB family protein n=1 Tax=unclassified Lentimonas TaxID=2630993 RepID=UPI0013898BF6|nr:MULTISPECIES: PQQ-binding-like beta-propeller repeat protein [unclassified Lentimonas]
MKFPICVLFACSSSLLGLSSVFASSSALKSFDTGYTITKVRSATAKKVPFIVASSYEGTVLALSYSGKIVWENPLSGFVNHDIWCADVTGDGVDEILAANADGSVYCLDALGQLLWSFKQNDVPMYSVCSVTNGDTSYIACGGFDLNMYYLDSQGRLLSTIPSATYSQKDVWHKSSSAPSNVHNVNFVRPLVLSDGSEELLMVGFNNHMQDGGDLYEFAALAKKPKSNKGVDLTGVKTLGDVHVWDTNGDGVNEVLFGTSQHMNTSAFGIYDLASQQYTSVNLSPLRKKIGRSHYLVTQPRVIPQGDSFEYLLLMGPSIVLLQPDLNVENAEVLNTKYCYNDLWQVSDTKFLFASSQSGGSCIHVLDTSNPEWKAAYEQLQPTGKLESILARRTELGEQVAQFKRPAHEVAGRARPPVYFLSEMLSDPELEKLANDLETKNPAIQFLGSKYTNKVQYPESWDRSNVVKNELYAKKRDSRHDYQDPRMNQDGILNLFGSTIDGDEQGAAYWGGHGNDPFFFSLETRYALVDRAYNNGGKKTVQIFPEMEHCDADFEWVVDHMFEPFAEYCSSRNANIYLRCKNISWTGNVYQKSFKPGADKPMWDIFLSGKYADVFVPSMEETTDKTMEISLAGRMGLWSSGAVNAWGTRAVRDNPSYDRSRQHCNQMLPNHFLTNLVFHLSNGAQYLNNFAVDQEYMSILWELIASGALYVPHRDEMLSINPVHLSMTTPHPRYLHEAHESKWNTCYDAAEEAAHPMVFSRMNATWMGAQTTPWDYSRYAADVKERRLSFISPYPKGVVLITPVQHGLLADQEAPRGKITDHLHPLYRNIMQEFLTDGYSYLSADGKETFAADSYYTNVAKAIEEKANLLPLTVTGDVGWVNAQSAPKHLRLTLVDTGYINPKARTAKVKFNTVTPVQITDVMTGEVIPMRTANTADIEVPLGSFRFIDIELKEALTQLHDTSN